MKSFLVLLLAVAFTAFTGCNRSSATPSVADPTPAAVYKAQRGIQLSPLATKTMGVHAGDVVPRDFKEAKSVAAAPAAALLRTVKGDFVYVANGGWFLRTPVKLGANDGAWFEIKEGLYEGDSVVTQGARAVWLAELQAVNGGVGCADDK